jgi:hypothetical protein
MVRLRKIQSGTMLEALISMAIVMVLIFIVFSFLSSQSILMRTNTYFESIPVCNKYINEFEESENLKDTINLKTVKLIIEKSNYKGNTRLKKLEIRIISKKGIEIYKRIKILRNEDKT